MKKAVIKKTLRKYHKYIGFAFSFFILYLSITGILLLYSDKLGINDKFLDYGYVLNRYNMSTTNDVFNFVNVNAPKEEIIIINKTIYHNKKFIDVYPHDITSGLFRNQILFIFSNKSYIKFHFENIDGNLELANIEEMALDMNLKRVGLDQSQNVFLESKKGDIYQLSKNEVNLIKTEANFIDWIVLKKVNDEIAKEYLTIHQGSGVSLHRVITELHNGKFFGNSFVFLLLLSTISIVFLVFSSFLFGLNFSRRKYVKKE